MRRPYQKIFQMPKRADIHIDLIIGASRNPAA